MSTHSPAGQLVYVGAYTRTMPHVQGKASGILVFRLDMATGALTLAHTLEGIANPSYLTLDARGRCLYCIEEIDEGRVHAIEADPVTGALAPLNRQPTHGSEPAHLSVDRTGRWLLVANYGSGSVAILPIEHDGRLGPATDVARHVGRSVNAERQEAPHAHWIGADAANRFVLVADLGMDAVLRYPLDAASGALGRELAPCAVQPGAGPRHLAFRPDERFAYVIDELDSTVLACAYDAAGGELRLLQRISTLPDQFTGINWTSAIRVAPSGRFVYGSNRGHDSIVIFAGDQETGLLSYVGHEPTRGRTPRDFNIDPTGTFLLAANQDDDTIVTFRIDAATGRLSATGHIARAETPVCIAFGPLP